jgi:signal peptidase I
MKLTRIIADQSTRVSLIVLVFVLLIAFLILVTRRFLLVVTIKGKSMSPTLQDGDQILALRQWPKKWLRTGQIVLIAMSPAPPLRRSDRFLIKRVAGVGGDRIVALDEEMSDPSWCVSSTSLDNEGRTTWVVPPKQFVARGDYSKNLLGPFPYKAMQGIYLMKVNA